VILIFGSAHHPGLQLVHQALLAREANVLFLLQEGFTGHTQMSLTNERGSLLLEGMDPLDLADVKSVCLDGFYVPPGYNLEGLDQADVEYLQTETWAMLVGLFGQLSRTALMANFFLERDHFSTRWGTLRFLASHGLPVPRALVTSDREALAEFRGRVGDVVFKPVSDPTSGMMAWTDEAEKRLENLSLAPVHFEEAPSGDVVQCSFIGDRHFLIPAEAEPPPEILEKCRAMARANGLTVCDVSLRCSAEGKWVASGLRPFVSENALFLEKPLDAMADLLEKGLA